MLIEMFTMGLFTTEFKEIINNPNFHIHQCYILLTSTSFKEQEEEVSVHFTEEITCLELLMIEHCE